MNTTASFSVPVVVRETACVLFLLSGTSGLLFETLWTYQATLALGSSYWAITAVLASFMAGLAIGNLLALRRSVWSLSTYAVLEGVILVSGLSALLLLPGLGRLLAPIFAATADHAALLNLLRFGISFALLVVPSTAMGMTLPALSQALGGEHGSFRSILGRLYGLNTLGAVAGVLLGELVLLPRAGVLGTGVAAASLNAGAALGAWTLSRRPITEAAPVPAWDRRVPPGLAPAFLSVFLAGFALLALEVVWTRFLALYMPNNSLAFALMLATVLSGIAVGGLAGGWARIGKRVTFLFPFGAGVSLVVSYAAFRFYCPAADVGSPELIVRVGLALQFPVSLLSGAFFTLAGAELRGRIPSSQASAGLLVLFNTTGAAAGAVLGGLLLVPVLGIEKSFFALAALYGVAALLWFRVGGGPRIGLALGAVAWILSLALFPFGQFRSVHLPKVVKRWMPEPNTQIHTVREGRTETIVFLQAQEFGQPLYWRMLTNSFSMSGTMAQADRYMRQFVYWPVALHPAPRRALLICFGVGNTASALVRTRELEHIDVVDISRDVLELSTLVCPDPATHPLKDPRVSVHVEDGRFFLQTRPETWDLITGEPPPPSVQGVAGLYSREYFRLLKDRLSEGGIATYWLPISDLSEASSRSIARSWSETFETSFLWRGSGNDFILVGIRGRPAPISERRFVAQWEDPATLRELIGVGLDIPERLGTGFVGDADYLRAISASAAPTEDAYPKRIVAKDSGPQSLYPDWFDLSASAERFRGSRSIQQLWPEEFRKRTLAQFDEERKIDYLIKTRFPDFKELHRVIRTTKLQSAVLAVLRSTRDDVRAAREAEPAAQSQREAQFHLGAGALAERDFARASEHFLRTLEGPSLRRLDLVCGLYTLCMAGRREEAERTLSARWAQVKPLNVHESIWAWLRETFGLKVPTD
jgi:spermidine synthase